MGKFLTCMRWIVAAATVVVLVIACWQCIDMYLDGNRPENIDEYGMYLTDVYGAEKIAARMRPLKPVMIGYALLAAAGLATQSLTGRAKTEADMEPERRLRLAKARINGLPDAALAEESLRRRIKFAAGACMAVCAALCLAFLLDGGNFSSLDFEHVMGRMALHIAPPAAIAFLVAIAAGRACARSIDRELAALKDVPESAPRSAAAARRFPVNAARAVMLLAAAALIVSGIMNGGIYDVLVKAIYICTECIGLG